MPKEHPILFSGPMVRAILEGRKTQTRRIIKPQPLGEKNPYWESGKHGGDFVRTEHCPKQPGDRLWVRESIRFNPEHNNFYYVADGQGVGEEIFLKLQKKQKPIPSIFMPRFASRLTLEIEEVKFQRIQAISGQDILEEGMPYDQDIFKMPCNIENAGETYLRGCFMRMWDSINAKSGHGWEVNDYVWGVKFKKQ